MLYPEIGGINMFIGRERELSALDRLYESNQFEFAVIYGCRRVGKTVLINQFIGDKKAVLRKDALMRRSGVKRLP